MNSAYRAFLNKSGKTHILFYKFLAQWYECVSGSGVRTSQPQPPTLCSTQIQSILIPIPITVFPNLPVHTAGHGQTHRQKAKVPLWLQLKHAENQLDNKFQSNIIGMHLYGNNIYWNEILGGRWTFLYLYLFLYLACHPSTQKNWLAHNILKSSNMISSSVFQLMNSMNWFSHLFFFLLTSLWCR